MEGILIRECTAIEEFDNCIWLQREVFGLPELEVSPRRHFIVSRQAGGWTLGAFVNQGGEERLVGFVHHLAAVRGGEIFGYSHMMAVAPEYQNRGVGARLKWSQRERAIREGVRIIKWTWDPMQARNAYFNLNRLGVTVSSYAENFYGTDYVTVPTPKNAEPPAIIPGLAATLAPGIDSDRLFAHWKLESERVKHLAQGSPQALAAEPATVIEIPNEWGKLLKDNPKRAGQGQLRVRREFQHAFAAGLICAGFERSEKPRYLLYEPEVLND